jgi:predicted nucleotidyltransferase/DNA-binding MarR family transcriptional regulator
MLAELLGSATRVRLLTILLGEPRREYHLRELIRLTGGSASGVQREVARLEEIGLVQSRRSEGGRRLIAAAQRHVLLEPLRTLLAAAAGEEAALGEEGAVSAAAGVHPSLQPRLDALVDVLRAAGVSRAALFGSAAQPHGEAPRDVDVVVRLGGPAKGRAARYFALRRALERAAGLPVDLVEEEAVDNPYLRDEIARTGVTLVAAA